jgi:hypothetical protein
MNPTIVTLHLLPLSRGRRPDQHGVNPDDLLADRDQPVAEAPGFPFTDPTELLAQ